MKKKDFDNLSIKKAVCGANHVLVLAGKSLFAWGNKESGQTGINPKSNIKYSYLFPHKFSVKNVDDIFTGLNHSFLVTKGKNKQSVLKGWGLNKHYQLGLGDSDNYHNPVKLYWFSDENITIKNVTGGDFHSIFLSEDNEIYVCGRNDEGQCGVESKIINENNEKYLNRYKIQVTTTINQNVDLNEIRDDLTNSGKINENEEREEGDFIKYPLKIEFFDKVNRHVDQIFSSMNFNYSIDTVNNQAYSWGLGYSYVLGNKKDNNEKIPFTIPKPFFKNMKIDQISLGCQHVAVSLTDSNITRPTLEVDMEHYKEELRNQINQKKTKTGKRRNALTDLTTELLEQNQEDLNAPRGLRPRILVRKG
jgi:alpha-tubulin suppressor-like RCC1 family protein